MNDNKKIYIGAFFSSVIDLFIAVIFLVIFSYLSDIVNKSIYNHFEYRKLFLTELSDGSFHWVTSAWNSYGSLVFIVFNLIALISLNKVVSGKWFSSSVGKKVFGLRVVSERNGYYISRFLIVLRYFLSVPLIYVCVVWSNIFNTLEIWQISLIVFSVYIFDFIVIIFSKDRKFRDYICGSRIQSTSKS